MSNQISASTTIENLAIVLAEQVKAGMPIEVGAPHHGAERNHDGK